MTKLPLSLFDDKECMRKAPKAALGKYLKTFGSVAAEQQSDKTHSVVIDGGWLLHQGHFTSGEPFNDIVSRYTAMVEKIAAGRQCSVVFDGYNTRPSPKDHEHKRRPKQHSASIRLTGSTQCTMTKARFLANGHNKSQLICLLRESFRTKGYRVATAEDDADTLIVREAIQTALSHTVEVRAEDTDVLCMLVAHCTPALFAISFQTKSGCFEVNTIYNKLPDGKRKVLLLAHAFSGCDTTSSIFGIGKLKVLSKLSSDAAPVDAIATFHDLCRASKDSVGKAGIVIMQYLYGREFASLAELRFQRYNKQMAKGKLDPKRLPPTEQASIQHSLRVFLQWRDWTLLTSQSLDPRNYGWELSCGLLEPIGLVGEIAPSSLLNFTTCNCQTENVDAPCKHNSCSCRRLGVHCLPACGKCHGISCSNSKQSGPSDSNDEHEENSDPDDNDIDID